MIRALAKRANFTYQFFTPSGLGSECSPQVVLDDDDDNDDTDDENSNTNANSTTTTTTRMFLYNRSMYGNQYNCGANDVNELSLNNHSKYATDVYAGLFYISPERQLKNRFTMPFSPPFKGTPVMFGTATRLRDLADLVQAQRAGIQPPACVLGSTANVEFLQSAFPGLQVELVYYYSMSNNSNNNNNSIHSNSIYDEFYQSMNSEKCPIHIMDYPVATNFVWNQYQKGQCLAGRDEEGKQKPIGIIGESMNFGLTHYALGVRNELPLEVVDTLSYWINILMTCNPQELEPGACYDEDHGRSVALSSLYQSQGGTGTECGYVLFPPEPPTGSNVNVPLVVGLTIGGSVGFLVLVFVVVHLIRLKQQEQRYKTRFVEQIARNIEIGPSPGHITPEKLAQEIQHIAAGKSYLCKADLQKWMSDIKLNFISQRDFDALWDAMDLKRTGHVDFLEFILFLSACGPQFHQVYEQHAKLPKSERLKLAARRLSNFTRYGGEAGVRKLEQKLDRGSREMVPTANKSPSCVSTTDQGPDAIFGHVKRSGGGRTSSAEEEYHYHDHPHPHGTTSTTTTTDAAAPAVAWEEKEPEEEQEERTSTTATNYHPFAYNNRTETTITATATTTTTDIEEKDLEVDEEVDDNDPMDDSDDPTSSGPVGPSLETSQTEGSPKNHLPYYNDDNNGTHGTAMTGNRNSDTALVTTTDIEKKNMQ
ncbi:hypothetical protein ACA910_006893 [Epithemia clementina (nom. ined.)]